MNTYEVEVIWRGGTYRETVTAMTAERARRAALERLPGGTVRRTVRVG